MAIETPHLRSERLVLRPFVDADTDGLYALMSNSFVLRYWDSSPWTERKSATRFLEKCRTLSLEGTGTRNAVERVDTGEFIGWCSLTQWNPDFRSASLGFCFTESSWGQGFATETVLTLLDWAYTAVDLNRVQAETDTRNLATARVLEKAGFVREGTLRQDCIVDGVVSDTWVYGLIRGDRTRPIGNETSTTYDNVVPLRIPSP